ncbi:MAG: hypothetical protein HQ537_00700 [Parcubacteria group bacterium]|nr:hypothetical protein [Parcubacteria group bacterium]
MKRLFKLIAMIATAFFLISGCAAIQKKGTTKNWEKEVKEIMNTGVTEADPNVLAKDSKSVITVEDIGDRVYYTITNPWLTPKGDTKGKNLKRAVKLKIASGILDAKGKNPYFTMVEVKDNKAEFSLPNFARAKGVKVPVVEHGWGYGQAADGTVGYLVLDPNSPWVVYKTKAFGGHLTESRDRADLETLAIGSVMYPGKPTAPLKAIGKGKLKQGMHPEL